MKFREIINPIVVTVVRTNPSEGATQGHFFVNNDYWGFTMEDRLRSIKIKGETAIPEGSYRAVVTYSDHFKRFLPLLLDVPGFDGIRVHSGNKPADTEGCLLVAKKFKALDWIFDSLEKALMDKLTQDSGGAWEDYWFVVEVKNTYPCKRFLK